MLTEIREAIQNLRPTPTVNQDQFWTKLQQLILISRGLYPGCGNDNTLTSSFGPSVIVYLDKARGYLVERQGQRVNASFARLPFRSDVFDVIFLQDAHAEVDEVTEIISTLRPGGLLIYSTNDCSKGVPGLLGDLARGDMLCIRESDQLCKFRLPFRYPPYLAFQKIATP